MSRMMPSKFPPPAAASVDPSPVNVHAVWGGDTSPVVAPGGVTRDQVVSRLRQAMLAAYAGVPANHPAPGNRAGASMCAAVEAMISLGLLNEVESLIAGRPAVATGPFRDDVYLQEPGDDPAELFRGKK